MVSSEFDGFSAVAQDHAEHPRNRGPLANFDGYARLTGPCGDTMEFWLATDHGKVRRVSFNTDGCGSSLACGSIATELAQGRRIEEAAALKPKDILGALGEFPAPFAHCALLAANALKAACENALDAGSGTLRRPATRVVVLVDDQPGEAGLASEHGLAFWIERGPRTVLFDTGQTDLVRENAKRLGLDLTSVDAVALSHGHYDHTGGLRSLFDLGVRPVLFMHPDALDPKYVRDKDGTRRAIGSPITLDEVRTRASILWADHPLEIFEGIYATGPVPRSTDFEDTGGYFFHNAAGEEPDLLWDDQSLFWQSARGIVVLLGCAHAGVVNTLEYIRMLMCGKPIHAVIGGMHLLSSPLIRLEATLAALRTLDVKMIAPVHCTGMKAMAYFQDQMPDRYLNLCTGSVLTLE